MTLPDSLAFWLFVPGLFLVLVFGWLVYLGRGRREVALELKGFGITISLTAADSKRNDPSSLREKGRRG